MAWQIYLPAISPWVDVRQVRGIALTGLTASYIKNSVSFLKSVFWFHDAGSSLWNSWSSTGCPAYNTSYNTNEPTNTTTSCLGCGSNSYNTSSTGTSFFDSYGLARDTASTTRFGLNGRHIYVSSTSANTCVLLPSRPLGADPIATETCNATVSTSLTGISYRTSYAHRRTWHISLLLDGPMDKGRTDFFTDAREYAIRNFLIKAEAGVTVHLQGRDQTLRNFTKRTDAPYIGCKNSISGQLNGASWKLEGQDNRAYRYKIDLDIDEDPSTGYVK